MKAKAKAHANIALIKYWGKANEELALPMNSSLSLTLDAFYTETEVEFKDELKEDTFYLDNELQDGNSLKRVSEFIDIFRNKKQFYKKAIVKSINHVPTAAGLASSASGFAALSAATNTAIGLNLSKKELSKITRRGSGSAIRSIYGGFVEWQMGNDDDSSFSLPIDDASWDIGMVIVVVNNKKKEISSRLGMKLTVETSPFYNGWVDSSKKDIINIKSAIENKDFIKMGEITESNSLKMHGTMLGANPPILYWEPETIMAMDIVKKLRKNNIPCYFTMDAGPNVKILCKLSQSNIIKNELMKVFDEDKIIISGPGPGIEIL